MRTVGFVLVILLIVSCSQAKPPVREVEPLPASSEVSLRLTGPTNYWKETWPNLEHFAFGGVTVLIDPVLVVDSKETVGSDGYPVFGKIKLSKDSDIFLATESGGTAGYKSSVVFEDNADNYFGTNHSICIPNNGYVYTIEYVAKRDRFLTTKKYKIEGNSLVEVKQPYYRVNGSSATNFDTEIFEQQDLSGDRIATIPKGQIVNILGVSSDGEDWFLLETPSGLIGWHKLEEPFPAEPSDRLPETKFTLALFDGYYP